MSRALLAAGGGLASLGVFLWAAPAKDQRNLVVPRTALVIGGGVRKNSVAFWDVCVSKTVLAKWGHTSAFITYQFGVHQFWRSCVYDQRCSQVIGLSSAYQLALRGVHVTVLEERQDTGQARSSLIRQSYKTRLTPKLYCFKLEKEWNIGIYSMCWLFCVSSEK